MFRKTWNRIKSAFSQKSAGLGKAHIGGSIFDFGFFRKKDEGYRNKIVYSVVNLLVDKLTEVPIIVADVKDNDSANKYIKSAIKDGTMLHVHKVQAFKENKDHPLRYVLENPNSYQTGIELRRAFWYNKIVFGEAFIYVEKYSSGRKKGEAKELHVIPSYMIEIIENEGNFFDPIKGYRFTYDGKEMLISKDHILYDGSWSPNSHFRSWKPMDTIGGTIEKNEVNEHAQMSAFKNGGTGILFSSDIVVDGVGGVSDKMPAEAMAELKRVVSSEYAGASNNKRMHFTNGFVNVQSFGDTLADLELLKAHQKDVESICAFYGVNPNLLYFSDSASTDSNVEKAYKALVTNNCVPKVRKFDALITKFAKDWYSGTKLIVYHDITEYSELLPDYEKIKTIYGGNPAISLDEYRELIGYTPKGTPEMKKHYITTGYIPLEDAGLGGGYDPSGILNRPI